MESERHRNCYHQAAQSRRWSPTKVGTAVAADHGGPSLGAGRRWPHPGLTKVGRRVAADYGPHQSWTAVAADLVAPHQSWTWRPPTRRPASVTRFRHQSHYQVVRVVWRVVSRVARDQFLDEAVVVPGMRARPVHLLGEEAAHNQFLMAVGSGILTWRLFMLHILFRYAWIEKCYDPYANCW